MPRLIKVLPSAVSRLLLTAPQVLSTPSLHGLVSPTMPTYWGASLHLPALWLQVMEYMTLLSWQEMHSLILQLSPVAEQVWVLFSTEYRQHRQRVLPHLLNPWWGPLLAPFLLSIGGSLAFTR